MNHAAPHIAVVGAGWAGCAAAVRAVQRGAHVTLYEANRIAGGRGRSLAVANLSDTTLDNGQHILIGAYVETLALMRAVGVTPEAVFKRLPLDLRTSDGQGLCLSAKAFLAQWNVLHAIMTTRGWSLVEKWHLLETAMQWQLDGFSCPESYSVTDLCQKLDSQVMSGFIEPLCLAAFNSHPNETSGAIFLRVLHDALLSTPGASDVLISRIPFRQLLPDPALAWLQAHNAHIMIGERVQALKKNTHGWQLQRNQTYCNEIYDHVILACPAWESARLVREWDQQSGHSDTALHAKACYWAQQAAALRHTPIATLYAWCPTQDCASLPAMQALKYSSDTEAQFVFHHSHRQRISSSNESESLLAFVISCCNDDRQALQEAVYKQAREQLGLNSLRIIRTLVEKRATFLCSPMLTRPATNIIPGLLACGDYIHGPYPATLEGAVRSGLSAANKCWDTE